MKSKRCPQSQRQRPIPKTTPRTPLITRPYFNKPTSSNDYIYQQTLKPQQTPLPWRLITFDLPPKKPTRRPKDLPPIPCNPRQILQDIEEMNRQLLVELEVSSSDSSPDSTPTQDQTDLQDHPEDGLILDQI